MGHIVTDKTREQWQIVFFITASIYLCGAIFCWFFGISFPSVMAIWSKWAPVYERSSMGNVTYTGIYIGGIIALLLSGVLAVKWGWESIFYFFVNHPSIVTLKN
uniref:Major facilitator superfamily (MFS) profile domain-containing protein n=1 Tax=Lutzomyia longipalpis TaxID=7200 RepID=A0A1B0CGB6_LUTLO